ncbi:hypothetical protein Dimus_021111 [Dionaea muscipula]
MSASERVAALSFSFLAWTVIGNKWRSASATRLAGVGSLSSVVVVDAAVWLASSPRLVDGAAWWLVSRQAWSPCFGDRRRRQQGGSVVLDVPRWSVK